MPAKGQTLSTPSFPFESKHKRSRNTPKPTESSFPSTAKPPGIPRSLLQDFCLRSPQQDGPEHLQTHGAAVLTQTTEFGKIPEWEGMIHEDHPSPAPGLAQFNPKNSTMCPWTKRIFLTREKPSLRTLNTESQDCIPSTFIPGEREVIPNPSFP